MDHPVMFEEHDPVLAAVREHALAFPGAIETITFGRPWFRAGATGRAFAIYGGGTKGPDPVRHEAALLVHVDEDELPARVQDARFFVPAYFGPKGWLGIDVAGPATDWTEVDELLDASFRHLAPRSLVLELDAQAVR